MRIIESCQIFNLTLMHNDVNCWGCRCNGHSAEMIHFSVELSLTVQYQWLKLMASLMELELQINVPGDTGGEITRFSRWIYAVLYTCILILNSFEHARVMYCTMYTCRHLSRVRTGPWMPPRYRLSSGTNSAILSLYPSPSSYGASPFERFLSSLTFPAKSQGSGALAAISSVAKS